MGREQTLASLRSLSSKLPSGAPAAVLMPSCALSALCLASHGPRLCCWEIWPADLRELVPCSLRAHPLPFLCSDSHCGQGCWKTACRPWELETSSSNNPSKEEPRFLSPVSASAWWSLVSYALVCLLTFVVTFPLFHFKDPRETGWKVWEMEEADRSWSERCRCIPVTFAHHFCPYALIVRHSEETILIPAFWTQGLELCAFPCFEKLLNFILLKYHNVPLKWTHVIELSIPH